MISQAPQTDHSLVRFENVGLRYGTGVELLSDVTFAILPRSFQFLTGLSGTGKTTLLRLITQTLQPTRGSIVLFGEDVANLEKARLTSLRRRMGIVFQDFRLLEHMTAYENVALPLKVRGRDEASYRSEVIELLKWVGLGDLMHSLPAVLSGGEKQRVSIARALVTQPDILLADEPTGNVDPSLARRLLRLFVELNRSGTAILIATHDVSLMDQIEGASRLKIADHRLLIEG